MSRTARQEPASGGVSALWFAVRISLFGIALTAFWTPLNTLVLPDLVDKVTSPSLRGTTLGIVTFVGIGMAVFIQPLAGAVSDAGILSDRRRPFIVAGAALAAVFVLPLPWLGSVWWLLAAYVVVQFGGNLAQAAFQALIPDLVEEREVGRASGVKSGFDVLGNAVGLAGVGLLVTLGAPDAVVVVFLAVSIAAGGYVAWRWVPPVPPDEEESNAGVGNLLRRAVEPLFGASREFKMAVLMRFIFLVGLYPVQRFLLYFLEDRFDLAEPMTQASFGILGAIVLGAMGAVVAGALSDRVGRAKVLRASVIISAVGLAGVAFATHLLFLGIAGAVLSIGAGAFQGANWALLSDSVPKGQGARYFAVANIATAGASAGSGALGPLVDLGREWIPAATYQITYGLCVLLVLATLLPLRASGADGPPRGQAEEQRARRTAAAAR